MSQVVSLAEVGNERYGVSALLGRGGMGAVYRATDRQTGGEVALKRLVAPDNERRRAQFTELFHQEFRTLAQLAHPQVVRVHDYGIDAHGPYYTMELLEGQALHDRAPLPYREACSLLRDVCSAVALLHSRRLLHRDLSPKNVQCMGDGRAKLIDFGAMAPMGINASVVGTPPLLPPEALLSQPLDGRADLYALGATLFYALTGTHAYPARNVVELRELWRAPLAPPSQRVQGVPPELDALVLSLLSHDASARPRSATEVIDRLSAIARLDHDEQLAVAHAYLVTPALVGREAQLTDARACIAELLAGRGGALVLEGAPGLGRSRMLDTAVLEAKLRGLAVARAGALDATRGPYGAIAALLRQLQELLPAPVFASASERSAFVLLNSGEITPEVDAERRPELHAVLIALLRTIARSQPIMLAVDDIERCDEASQAALASVQRACRRERVLIALTCPVDAKDNGALSLLREGSTLVALTPFALEHTEALLGSVFGDVPNLQLLAARIHERAEGSPRGCMELAEHLNQRGLVRYRAGSWELPAAIAGDELPSSLSFARRMRLGALSDDARELCEALALAEGCGLEFDAYAELCAHADLDRVRSALDELLLAQVLRCDGVQYSFEAQALPATLRDELEASREQAACARIAAALARRNGDRLIVARYAWRAGDKARTIELLLAELAHGSRWDRCPNDYGEILLGAAQACLELGRSRRDRFVLVQESMRLVHDLGLPDMRAYLTELFAQLRVDSGLRDWEAQDPALDPLARLRRAFELAQQRHDAQPVTERGLPPIEAIQALVRLVIDSAAVGAQTGDMALIALLPSLVAFYPVSPAIERVERFTVPACKHVVAGRYEEARELYLQSLGYLRTQVDVPGLDENMRQWSLHAVQYALGCIEGALSGAAALEHAGALERSARWLVPAYSVRRIYHLTLGEHRTAERCRRQIELLLLQSPIKPPLAAGALHQHLFSFSMADDLTGMQRAIPDMDALSRVHPSLGPFVAFARAEVARICGDFEGALAILSEMQMEPGMHPLWCWVAGAQLSALRGLGRLHDAHALGLQQLAAAEAHNLRVIKDHVEAPLALIEARLGAHADACARLDRIIASRMQWSARGVQLGWACELRARVAAWMGDADSFERFARLCAQQYRNRESDPALSAKYERLILEARALGIRVPGELIEGAGAQGQAGQAATSTLVPEVAAAIDALATCTNAQERARRALTLLLDGAGAQHGELYLTSGSGLALRAASREDLSDGGVHSTLCQLIESAVLDDDLESTATLSFHAPPRPGLAPRAVWPLVLTSSAAGQSVVVGIAALHFAEDQPVRIPFELAAVAADAFVRSGDILPQSLSRTQVG